MWSWVVVAVALGVAGLAVIAAFAVRLWRQVRELGRQVAAAGDRLAQASEDLQRLAPPPSGR